MSEAPKKPSNREEVAEAYARKVIELAESDYTYKEWGASLQNVSRFVQNDEVRNILRNPMIPRSHVVEMVQGLLKRAEASQLETAFILTLTQQGALPLVPMISEKYTQLSQRAMGFRQVRVVSAEKLSLKEEVTIKKLLKDRFNIKAELTKAVDPSLIAGFTLSFDDKVIDQSTKGYRERAARMKQG